MSNASTREELLNEVEALKLEYKSLKAMYEQEISEHEKELCTLRESNEKFKAIANYAASWEVWLSPEGKLLWMNPYSIELTGYTPEEYMAAKDYLSMVIAEEDIEYARGKLTEALQGSSADNIETRVKHKDGSTIWVSVSWRPIFDAAGNSLGFRTSTKNIMERKRVEGSLKVSEIKYRELVNNFPDAIVIYVEGKIVFVNNELIYLIGAANAEELIGKPVLEYVHPEYREFVIGRMKVAMSGRTASPPADEKIIKLDGSAVDVEIKAIPITFENQSAVLLVMHDITERKLAEKERKKFEKAFRESAVRLKRAELASKSGNWELLLDSKIMIASEGAEKIYGLKGGLFEYNAVKNIPLPEYRPILDNALKGLIEKAEPYNIEFKIKNPESGEIIDIHSVAEYDREEHIIFGIIQDITGRKRVENELRDSERILHQAQQVARIGHYVTDINTGIWKSSPVLDEIFGIDHLFVRNIENWSAIIEPEYRGKLTDYYYKVISDKTRFEMDYKIIRPNDGQKRWVSALGEFDYDASGNPVRQIGTIQDITERKRAENALKESEEQFRNLFVNAPVGIFHSTLDGRLLETNPALAKMLGYFNTNEIIASTSDMSTQIYVDPKVRLQIIDDLMRTDGWVHYNEVIWQRKDLSLITVEMTGRKVLDAAGDFTYLEGFIVDITERKRVEEALREGEEKYRSLIQYSSDPIFSFNPDGTYKFANEAFSKQFGKTPDEVMGKTPHFLFPFDVAEKRLAFVRKVFQTGEKGEIELNITTASGERKYFLTMIDPIKDIKGNILWVSCVSKDITERKLGEEALRESEEKHRFLIEHSYDIIYILTPDGILTFVSQAWTNLLGHSVSQVEGLSFQQFVHPDDIPECLVWLQKVISTGQRQEGIEYRIRHINGTWRWHTSSAVPLRDINGTVIGFEGTARDITERKQAEEELHSTNKQLEKSNSEKDKLFSIIAHDLRSPFHGLLGLSEILAKDSDELSSEEVTNFSISLHTSIENLYKLIENLLQWGQLQKDSIEFAPKVLNLSNAFIQGMDAIQQRALQKGITIINEIPETLKINADEKMISSVLRNLLSNAVKFTRRDGKVIGRAQVTENGMIEISVTDTGTGMPADIVEKIFKIGEKVGRLGTENEPSTGLGLVLCREFVEKHGGKIWVESEEGKGSTFYFSLKNNG